MAKVKHSEIYKKIGRNIARIRTNQGYTQETFAYKIGVSYSYLTQIEAPNVINHLLNYKVFLHNQR